MPKFIDLTNKQFGKLLVLHRDTSHTGRRIRWMCKCECGTIKSIMGEALRSGNTVTCSKCKSNYIGRKYNSLTIIKRDYSGNKKIKTSKWICRCDCGNTTTTYINNLKTGGTKSCGCYKQKYNKEKNTTHGKSATKLYNVWSTLKDRCLNEKNPNYRHYGGKGIKVHRNWLKFENFYKWSIDNGYELGLSIDRINNDGNYTPINCRWITMREQSWNRSTNNIVVYKNRKICIGELSKITGINYDKLHHRLTNGFSVDEAIQQRNYLRRKKYAVEK